MMTLIYFTPFLAMPVIMLPFVILFAVMFSAWCGSMIWHAIATPLDHTVQAKTGRSFIREMHAHRAERLNERLADLRAEDDLQ
jgi:hypothetical protein